MNSNAHESIRVLQIIGNVCRGGVEAVVMNYYRHIDRNRIQFDFVIDDDSNPLLDDEITSLGGRVYKVEPYSKNIFKQIYQVRQIVKENGYEIVHSHMNTLSVFSLFAAWLGGAHTRIVHNHSTATDGEVFRTAIKYILRPFAKLFANQYAACSMLAAQWMFGDLAKKQKVTVFNNAIDLDMFSYDVESRNRYRAEFGIGEDAFVIGHIGRFVYQKNHDFLIDVMAEVAKKKENSILLLIGDGPLDGAAFDKVQKMGLADRVEFLGLREDVAKLYNSMDVFVLPSWYEGLPVVAVEAQANGLQCLVSDRISAECQLTSGLSFMQLEQSAEAWAGKILQLPQGRDTNVKGELRESGFDIRRESKKLQDFYETLYKL